MQIKDIYVEGQAWALSLKAGDKFLGCAPVARERYPNDPIAQDLFISAAYDTLQEMHIAVDESGYITKIKEN